jgi:hypothetical protein
MQATNKDRGAVACLVSVVGGSVMTATVSNDTDTSDFVLFHASFNCILQN